MRILGTNAFPQFFENSPLAMWIFDLADLRFLAVNKAACRQYEYGEDEFLEMTLRDVRAPEHLNRLDDALAATVVQGNSGPPSLWEHRTKSGRRLLVEALANLIDLGELKACIAVLRDVTAEHARDAERISFFELSRDVMVIRSFEDKLVAVNPAFSEILGWSRDEVIGHDTNEFVHPEDVSTRVAALRASFAESGFHTWESRARAKDGSYRWFQWSTTVDFVNERAYSTGRDVSARRDAEEKLETAYEQTLEGWARALDLRDHETVGHSRRVTELTMRLATRLELPGEELKHIRRGALLHDIGKVGIPDSILLKPGALTAEERAVMQRHTEHGFELLAPIEFLRPALDIPDCHHEKWDGTGYPAGLRGEDIPLSARLFALADVWDALTSHRPYREAWPIERVREYFVAESGRHFDPALVPIFLELVTDGEPAS